MANQFNINGGLSALRSLINDSLQSFSDLSGKAYQYAQQSESISKQQLEKFNLEPESVNQSRLDNLEKIRQQLQLKNADSREDDVVIKEESIVNNHEVVVDQVEEVQSSSMEIDKLRTIILDKFKSGQYIENLKVVIDDKQEKEVVTARIIVNSVTQDGRLIGTVSDSIKVVKLTENGEVTYNPVKLPNKYILNPSLYRLDKSSFNEKVEFDDLLKKEITLIYDDVQSHENEKINEIKVEEHTDHVNDSIVVSEKEDVKSENHQVLDEKEDQEITVDQPETNDTIKLTDHKETRVDNNTTNDGSSVKETTQTIVKPKFIDDKVTKIRSRHHVQDKSVVRKEHVSESFEMIQTTKRFSRLVKLVDIYSNEELDRLEQDFEVNGYITTSGFEPKNHDRLSFNELEFDIPEGYERSNKPDNIEISVLNPYLLVQSVYLISDKQAIEDEFETELEEHSNEELSETTEPIYFNETLDILERNDIETDDKLVRTISRKIQLYHHKNGLIEEIEQEAKFEAIKEDNQLKWLKDYVVLDSINLRLHLEGRQLLSSRDVSSLRLTPHSHSIIEKIVVYDQEDFDIHYEKRKVLYVCDDEILESVDQTRKVIIYRNVNDGSERKEYQEFAKPAQVEFSGYQFKDQKMFKDRIEMRYSRLSENFVDVLNELPSSPKSKSYTGQRIEHDISNSIVAGDKLSSLMRRVRTNDGVKLTDFSHSFKVIGRPITEEAIADEVFKKLISDYHSIATSRVKQFNIKTLGPVYSGSGLMRNVKQFVYTVHIRCV